MESNLLDIKKSGIVVDKKSVDSKKTDINVSKTGGMSLFDSLMKDVQKEPKSKEISVEKNTNKDEIAKRIIVKNSILNVKKDVDKVVSSDIIMEVTKKVAKDLVDVVIIEHKLTEKKANKDVETKSATKNIKNLLVQIDTSKYTADDTKKTKKDVQIEKENIDVKIVYKEIKKDIVTSKIVVNSKILPDVELVENIEEKNTVKNIVPKEIIEDVKATKIVVDGKTKVIIADESISKGIEKITEDVNTPKTIVDNKIIMSDKSIKNSPEIDTMKATKTSLVVTVEKEVDKKIGKKDILKDDIVEKKVKSSVLIEPIKKEKKQDIKTIDKIAEKLIEDILIEENIIQPSLKKDENITPHKLEKKENLIIKSSSENIVANTIEISDIKKADAIIKDKLNNNIPNNTDTSTDKKNPLMANMFLSSQKNEKDIVSTKQLSKAQNNIEEKKTISSIKQSGNMLDLNVKKIDVVTSKENIPNTKIKQSVEKNLISSSVILNKMLVDNSITKNIDKNIINQVDTHNDEKVTVAPIQNKNESNTKEIVVTVNVPTSVVETIQNKIIGAQQKVSSFMSDISRSMYLNYKPPVNTFKINLNPANLGSISIVMRSNKADNTVSVSMNMSNSSTMDVFSDNKSQLQTSLMKNFNDGSNVNLSFNMQGDDSKSGFEQFNQDKNDNKNDEQKDDSILSQEKEKDNDNLIKDNDYM